MFARMDSAPVPSDDNFISSIAPHVMRCLGECIFFEKLDDLLSPESPSTPSAGCDGTYKFSESILADRFDRDALDDIFDVLKSKGGFCDCEILYNVVDSRLKAKYWRSHAAGETPPTRHSLSN